MELVSHMRPLVDAGHVSWRQVVAIKAAKVGSWNTKSLTLWTDSAITMHPDMPEAYQLQGWWQTTGSQSQLHSISVAGGGGGKPARRIVFSDIDELALGYNADPASAPKPSAMNRPTEK